MTYLRLGTSDSTANPPYRLLGGNAFGCIMSILYVLFVSQAIGFFICVPGSAIDSVYAGPIPVSILMALAVREVLLAVFRRQASDANDHDLQDNTAARRLLHAGGVCPACRNLDAMARATR